LLPTALIKVKASIMASTNARVEGGKNTRRGGLNCVFKNVSFLRKIALFSGYRV